jgi:hypothetical protein
LRRLGARLLGAWPSFTPKSKQEIYEIPTFDSEPGSFDWNGDGSDTAETVLLQRQRVLQDGLL